MPIAELAAWTRADVGGKAGFAHKLQDEQLVALEQLLRQTRWSLPQQVTREAFDHPVVNEFVAELRREIFAGRSAAVIQGLSPDRFSAEDLERICWGFGTHLGLAAVQSVNGDRLGRVRNELNNPKVHGYQNARELAFHSDAYELLGLMCIQNAKSGGHTRLVSALSIHNEILKLRPDLLPSLYRGFPYAVAKAFGASNPVTAMNVPVFSCVAGKVSCMYLPRYMRSAAQLMNTTLPEDLEEALQYFKDVSVREDLVVEFLLEPGEMLICHNFTNLHARTEFADAEGRKRYLLRLWLTVSDGRPCDPAVLERGAIYDRLYREAQKVAGMDGELQHL
jgi:hypothetical protein